MTAIYEQFINDPPPWRFVNTVEAYMDYIRQTDRSWSLHQIEREGGPSHGYISSLRDKLQKKSKYSASSHKVEALVKVLNRHVPATQYWPLHEAMRAAGIREEDIARPQTVGLGRTRMKPSQEKDALPFPVVRIPAPVLGIDSISKDGLSAAASPQPVFHFASNMAFIKDSIPGYPHQSPGEWAIIQAPNARLPEGLDIWALVRDGPDIRAVPRNQKGDKDVVVIAWIIGTFRIAAPLAS